MDKYKILCCDGGGVRGVIQARIIQNLGLKAHDFNMISGTSVGSINAIALASGFNGKDLVDFYKKEAKNIFKRRALRLQIFRSKYDISDLEKVLKTYFKNETLESIKNKYNIDMIIPTFCLNTIDKDSGAKVSMPKVYSSFNNEDIKEPLYQIACKSSAAPTYFQSYKGFIDGGIAANNPSIEAVCSAINNGIDQEKIQCISIGTGISDNCVSPKDWGLVEWAPFIIDFIFQGTEEISEFCSKNIVKDFKRYQIRIKNYAIDDVGKIQNMIDDVDRWFEKMKF